MNHQLPSSSHVSAPVSAHLGALVRRLGAPLALLCLFALVFAALYHGPSRASGAPISPDCTLLVPANPLSAAGLATPYQLRATNVPVSGACSEAVAGDMAFVQAAVLDPVAGSIAVYDPLVIDQGSTPAAAPVMPALPAGAIVALWFGDNGAILRLAGADAPSFAAAQCVSGVGKSLFGQVSACNTTAFWAAANALLVAKGPAGLTPAIPALGTAADGLPCPSVRDALLVDQDPSDNVTTSYLVTAGKQIAQNTAANRTALAGAGVQINGSDNKVLTLLDAALGCTPYMAPDLADPGAMIAAQPLNELQAAQFQANPVDLVPIRDDMTMGGVPVARGGDDARLNVAKTNAYRALVDQPLLTSKAQGQAEQTLYCASLYLLGAPRLAANQVALSAAASPFPAQANSLYTFLAARMDTTVGPFPGLGCRGLLDLGKPFVLSVNGAGVVTAAVLAAPYTA